MKKFKTFLIILALTFGIGGAFAFERPDILGAKRGCAQPYPWCLGGTQYVMGCAGQLVLAPQGGYGSTWVCKYNTNYICTYSYEYCPEWGGWYFLPCKTGEFCFFNPDYTCQPCPPWSFLSGKDSASGKDLVIIPTEAQKKKMEELTKEALGK